MLKGIAALFAAVALLAAAPAHAEEKKKDDTNSGFDQGKKGDALGGLERTAGKKAGDVNVPPPPPPSPAPAPAPAPKK